MSDKNVLSCEVVRDLLPNYIDGLTCGVTNAAVEKHLEDCEDCRGALERMRPQPVAEPKSDDVDYLKAYKKKSRRTAIICAAAVLLIAAVIFCIRCFGIGTVLPASALHYNVSYENGDVIFNATARDSGKYIRTSVSENDGIVTLNVHTSLINLGGIGVVQMYRQFTPKEPVKQIYIGDTLVWDNGTELRPLTVRVFETRHDYIGDMPANASTAAALGISDRYGAYKNELQTDSEPYGWTLILESPISAADEKGLNSLMKSDSCVLMAVIGNLGEVTWKYTVGGQEKQYTVTLGDAAAAVNQDIKSCGVSAVELQKLLQKLNLMLSPIEEAIQETGYFNLVFSDFTHEDIRSATVRYYLGGKLIGSRTCENADGGNVFSSGQLIFDFCDKDFPRDMTGADLSDFNFDLIVGDKDGNDYTVCAGERVAAKYAWSYCYSLTGSFAEGFVMPAG